MIDSIKKLSQDFELSCNEDYISELHKIAIHESEDATYTSMLRQLNKEQDPAIVREFRTIFKQTFDDAIMDGTSNPEEKALQTAIKFIDNLNENIVKKNSIIYNLRKFADNELGNPHDVGIYLSNLIRFILRKISDKNRNKSIRNLRNKIYMLNEYELANKKMPPASSLGQSLVIVKHLMFGKEPQYIRQVLNSIVSHLGS